eukprot:gnl/MRDRNA2_/MRDRNA2_112720_c0_seq1.p1 gnl/MRDRNA2_/MRDRNA2_112720_c0~~gnl/MRDRNA2_/MRDRNA2_112720_c0_seq1.p1  ORF type:complete len:148 (+),score=11.79 gnl/MRDRNA2_/MRDRNA2_112720_c0_seq1:31-474(+)
MKSSPSNQGSSSSQSTPLLSKPSGAHDLESEPFSVRLADAVAGFLATWTFLSVLILYIILHICFNLYFKKHAFDPYPFIFLNLVLSALGALSAPIILISQYWHSKRQERLLREIHSQQYDLLIALKRDGAPTYGATCNTTVDGNFTA